MTDPLTRAGLLLVGLVYASVAVPGFLDPAGLLAEVGLEVHGPSAHNELRANYGGLMAALSITSFVGAFSAAHRRPVLWLSWICFVGLVSGRVLSLILDGTPNSFALGLLGAEAFGLTTSSALLWAGRER